MTRFLRDLCTRAELEALAHRWQTARLLDEGVPYLEIAERVPTSTATVTRVAQWVRHGAGGYRIALAAGEAAMSAFTRAGENGRLTLAVPAKGRMAEPTLRLCADAGLSFETTERSLVVPCANAPVDLLLVRPSDIPEYVQDGVVHLGVTGANLVVEATADVVTLAELGFARCTLAGCGPERCSSDFDRRPRRTPRCDGISRLDEDAARRARHRGPARPVPGSVEATPRLGLADAIVDLVSTGSTASANGLRLIGSLPSSQAVLIGGRGAVEEQHDLVERLELTFSGVVAARRRRYVMMNATTETLPAIRAVLPSMGASTVLELADEGEFAVHAAVAADDVWALLPALRDAGGHLDSRPADRAARAVRGAGLDDVITVAAPIVADVRDRGDAALLDWTERFDGPRPEGIPGVAGADRGGAVPDDVLELCARLSGPSGRSTRPSGRSTRWSRQRRASSRSAAGSRSMRSGSASRAEPFPLPSSLVMAAVPALVAGVRRSPS